MTTLHSIGETDRELLGLVRDRPHLTSITAAQAMVLSRAQAQLALRRLSDAGLLDRSLNIAGEYVHTLSPEGATLLERATAAAH
jgi:predicted transcriptional regulator